MTAKELLQERVAALSEEEATDTLHFLDHRLAGPQIPLADVPFDDEPVTPEEEAAIQEGLDALARGDVISLDELRAELG